MRSGWGDRKGRGEDDWTALVLLPTQCCPQVLPPLLQRLPASPRVTRGSSNRSAQGMATWWLQRQGGMEGSPCHNSGVPQAILLGRPVLCVCRRRTCRRPTLYSTQRLPPCGGRAGAPRAPSTAPQGAPVLPTLVITWACARLLALVLDHSLPRVHTTSSLRTGEAGAASPRRPRQRKRRPSRLPRLLGSSPRHRPPRRWG
mmetsp:Transcript_21113/g.61388  ORF Transcript_21113/g.61388 Transcript_21113/m.61388 type:complete len:201 (+) Transcript_21113:3103-3705(+)